MAEEAIALYLEEQKARGEQIVDDSNRLMLMLTVEAWSRILFSPFSLSSLALHKR